VSAGGRAHAEKGDGDEIRPAMRGAQRAQSQQQCLNRNRHANPQGGDKYGGEQSHVSILGDELARVR